MFDMERARSGLSVMSLWRLYNRYFCGSQREKTGTDERMDKHERCLLSFGLSRLFCAVNREYNPTYPLYINTSAFIH